MEEKETIPVPVPIPLAVSPSIQRGTDAYIPMLPILRSMRIGLLRRNIVEHSQKGRDILFSSDWLGIWIVIRGSESFHVPYDIFPMVMLAGFGGKNNHALIRIGYVSAFPDMEGRWIRSEIMPTPTPCTLGFVRTMVRQGRESIARVPYWTGFQGFCYVRLYEGSYIVLLPSTVEMLNAGEEAFPDVIPSMYLRTTGYGIPRSF